VALSSLQKFQILRHRLLRTSGNAPSATKIPELHHSHKITTMGEFVDKTAAREAELVWNRDSNLVRSDWVNGTGTHKKNGTRRLAVDQQAFVATVYSWRNVKAMLCICRSGSSVGIATELRTGRSGMESRWGRDFPPVQTGPEAHPVSCKMGIGSLLGVKCGRGVLLTTHPLLMPFS